MNILFTGIGGPTPLGLAKSLKLAHPDYICIGADASVWAPSLYQSDVLNRTYRIPNASDQKYWDAIQTIVDKEKIDFAFIVPETEVLVWTKRAEKNQLPCRTHIPDHRLAEFCFDKLRVARSLFPLGLAPKTIEVETSTVLTSEKFELEFPYWIRVKSGAGALGALRIDSEKDLKTWLALHGNRNDFMASTFLPGRNYACKLLYHKGELVQSASAERIDYLLSAAAPSGISGMCARGRLLNRPDLVEKAKAALNHIANETNSPLHGIFTIDFKEDIEGKPLITEINIRHVSFTLAFALGGINLAESTIKLYQDMNFKIANTNEFLSEDYFVRGVDAPLRLISQSEIKKFS